MLNIIPGRFFRLSSVIGGDTNLNIVAAGGLIKIGTNWYVEKTPDITATAINAALANGANMTLYTVTAAKRGVIYALNIAANNVNAVYVQHAAITLISMTNLLNVPYSFLPSRPWILPSDAGEIRINNGSGAAILVSANILLAEYP